MKMDYIFNSCVALLGTAISYLYGGWTQQLGALLLFVTADYVTGYSAAASKGELKSKIGANGIRKKIGIFGLVAVCHIADIILGVNMFMTAAIWFYLSNELLSIIENVDVLGVPIPPIIRKAVEIINSKQTPLNGNLR